MPTLIESLLQNSVAKRPDARRLFVTRRPTPSRPRDLFEVFGALGQTASFPGVRRSIDIKSAEPRKLTNVILGRWPTQQELAALPEPYDSWRHLCDMMMSQEFRIPMIRRICDAFPEKRRLMHVRIPSCAGRHVETVMNSVYPILRTDIGGAEFNTLQAMATYFGVLFNRCNMARSVCITLPRMAPFIDAPEAPHRGEDVLHWTYGPAPYRAIDLVFAIIRSPVSLALSQVNGTVMRLRDPNESGAGLQRIFESVGPLPAANRIGHWKRIARVLLHQHLPKNPVCHALADGTAAGAFDACARVPVELVNIADYADWCRSAFEAPEYAALGVSDQVLAEDELNAEDRAAITSAMGEDAIFWERYVACSAASGVPAVTGVRLAEWLKTGA